MASSRVGAITRASGAPAGTRAPSAPSRVGRQRQAVGHGLARAGLRRDQQVARPAPPGSSTASWTGVRCGVAVLGERAGQRRAGVFKGQGVADTVACPFPHAGEGLGWRPGISHRPDEMRRRKLRCLELFAPAPSPKPSPRLAGATDEAISNGRADCPRFTRRGEAQGLLGGAEQGARLVHAFALFARRIGVGDDAAAGLHMHHAVLDHRGAQHDAGVHLAVGGEIADAPP